MPDTELSKNMPDAELSRVALKAPPFWETNPELWFIQLESQFKLSGITVDDTKFHVVVAALDSKILSSVSDIIRAPPAEKKYDILKKRILDHFSQSESSKLRLLLQELMLGDKRPSQLLQEMRNLSNGKIGDDVLKSLWLQRLPIAIQQILSVSQSNLDDLSLIADKVNEVSSFTSIVESISPDASAIQSLKNEVAELRSEIQRISRPRFRQFNRNRQRVTSQSKERSKSRDNKMCWYHRRFAHKALKCISPCNFSGN